MKKCIFILLILLMLLCFTKVEVFATDQGSETFKFNKNTSMEGSYATLITDSYTNDGWNAGNLTIRVKEGSGKQIKRICATIGAYANSYTDITVSAGVKREVRKVYDGNTVNVLDIHRRRITFSGAMVMFSSITVYYEDDEGLPDPDEDVIVETITYAGDTYVNGRCFELNTSWATEKGGWETDDMIIKAKEGYVLKNIEGVIGSFGYLFDYITVNKGNKVEYGAQNDGALVHFTDIYDTEFYVTNSSIYFKELTITCLPVVKSNLNMERISFNANVDASSENFTMRAHYADTEGWMGTAGDKIRISANEGSGLQIRSIITMASDYKTVRFDDIHSTEYYIQGTYIGFEVYYEPYDPIDVEKEVITFKNEKNVSSNHFTLTCDVSTNYGWPGGCDDCNLTITAKEGSGLQIMRIEAIVSGWGEYYGDVGISVGTKRENGELEDESFIHIDDIHSTTFSFAGGIDWVYFKDITIYCEPVDSNWQDNETITDFSYFTAYITPFNDDASYAHGHRATVDGELRYYYTDLNKAIADAKGYSMTEDDVLYLRMVKDKSSIPTDIITLISSAASCGFRGGSNANGYGLDNNGDIYGISKGIVIDLNGNDIMTISAGNIKDDQILVIMNSSDSESSITSSLAFDDETSVGYCSGEIVFSNVFIDGEIRLANHKIILCDDLVSIENITWIKKDGIVMKNSENIKLFDSSDSIWAAYVVSKDELGENQYPNGQYYYVDNEVRYYYSDLSKAIEEAKSYSAKISKVRIDKGTTLKIGSLNLNNSLISADYSDRVVLLKSTSAILGSYLKNTAGRGVDEYGNSYGIHKGIIIDLNGFDAGSIAAGVIPSDEVLLITNSSSNVSTLSTTSLDDENGTGYCSGKIVYNNIKTTADFYVANHTIYLIDGDYNLNGTIKDVFFDGIVHYNYLMDSISYNFDPESSMWSCYIVSYIEDATLEMYPLAEQLYEKDGKIYLYYQYFENALNDALAGSLQIEDCLDENGYLKDDILTDCIVCLKEPPYKIGESRKESNGFGKNEDGTYCGIHKGIMIDLNGYSIGEIVPGAIPRDQVFILTNSAENLCLTSNTNFMCDDVYCIGNVIINRLKIKGNIYLGQHKLYLSNCDLTYMMDVRYRWINGEAKLVVNGVLMKQGTGVYEDPENPPVDDSDDPYYIYKITLEEKDFSSNKEYQKYLMKKSIYLDAVQTRSGEVLDKYLASIFDAIDKIYGTNSITPIDGSKPIDNYTSSKEETKKTDTLINVILAVTTGILGVGIGAFMTLILSRNNTRCYRKLKR